MNFQVGRQIYIKIKANIIDFNTKMFLLKMIIQINKNKNSKVDTENTINCTKVYMSIYLYKFVFFCKLLAPIQFTLVWCTMF